MRLPFRLGRGDLVDGAGQPNNVVLAEGPLPDTRSVEYLAEQLAAVPGVVAVTLGGSRAVGAAAEGSDWDFGLLPGRS